MDIRELQIRYSKLPQAKALLSLLGNDSRQTVQLQGLTGSAAPLFFSGVAQLMEVSRNQRAMVFILNDADEAVAILMRKFWLSHKEKETRM